MNAIEDLKKKLVPRFKRHDIQKAILFGSFARGGQSRRSDVDLILLQETDKRFWDRYDHILLDLGNAIQGCSIDALIYTPAELARIEYRPFIRQALPEGIVLYEPNESRLID